jgi:NADH-quinone oxidoreductase subunit F
MLEILERITLGKGRIEDISTLDTLAQSIKKNSLCALGGSAPNPVLTTIKYFRDEYEAHILEKRCPAKKCLALINYSIDAKKCVGCGLCLKSCAVKAISGTRKQLHSIDSKICIRCGNCIKTCRVGAITVQ